MKTIYLCIVAFSFFAISCQQNESKPNLFDPLELTVAEIHDAYRSGSFTCEDLMTAYLDRIAAYDQQTRLNAITYLNPKALEEARAMDVEFKRTGKLRLLHGIPMLVKDNYHTAGMPTTAGSITLKDFIPDDDAFQVRKLKEAGAIIIAKTNMAEWAFSAKHTHSSTAGETRNPYNLARVPAGSSGGTAAGMAANFAAIGLGTDTGNSIRGPSSHTALVGFRSTLGLTSRHGIIPLYMRNDVGGPMCRTVEDATRVLQAIAGFDPADQITKHSEGKVPESYLNYLDKDGLKNARIGVLRELSEADPHPEIKALFDQAVKDLERLGAIVVDPVVVPDFAELRKNQWCADFRQDIEAYLAEHVKRDSLRTIEDIIAAGPYAEDVNEGLEYFRTTAARKDHEVYPCLDPYSDKRRIAFREAIEKEMDRLELDAIIFPSWNHPAAIVENYAEGYKGDNSQIISPHTGQPGFTVPMGFTSENLPAGLQFLGRMYDEPTLIKLTFAYEQGTLHRKQPELYPGLHAKQEGMN